MLPGLRGPGLCLLAFACSPAPEPPAGPAVRAPAWMVDHAAEHGLPDGMLLEPVRVDETWRPAVQLARGQAWELPLDRSEAQVLRTHVVLREGSTPGARGCFRVRLDGEILTRRCVRARAGWVPIQVALPAEPGRTSTLRLSLGPGKGHEEAEIFGAFGDPSLDPLSHEGALPEDAPPDLVLLVVDTLRADALGVGGHPSPAASPALDALAQAGTWYAQARAPSPWTLPSMGSLLTGLPLEAHGAGWRTEARRAAAAADRPRRGPRTDLSPVDPDVTRLAERLRTAGYRTDLVASNLYLEPRFGFAEGFSSHAIYRGSSLPGGRRALERVTALLEHAPFGAGRPRFLVVHLFEPHLPYRVRQPLPEGLDAPEGLDLEHQAYGGQEADILRELGPEARARPEQVRRAYQADVRYGDDVLGELLALLPESAGVVLTSDHGEAMGEHGTFLHGDHLYDETVRVPLIVRWPDGSRAGTRVDVPVDLAQVAGTLAELGGVQAPGPALPDPVAPVAYTPVPLFQGFVYTGPDRLAVLRWPHKRIWTWPLADGPEGLGPEPATRELYDLSVDPGETVDLSSREPALAAELDALLAAHSAALDPPEASVPLDDEDLEALRALGYVD